MTINCDIFTAVKFNIISIFTAIKLSTFTFVNLGKLVKQYLHYGENRHMLGLFKNERKIFFVL
jgi:hypothetical protein